MFNFGNRAVEKIARVGSLSLVLIVAMGRIEPFLRSRLANRFVGRVGPWGPFAGLVLSAIHRLGSEALFNRVLEELKNKARPKSISWRK